MHGPSDDEPELACVRLELGGLRTHVGLAPGHAHTISSTAKLGRFGPTEHGLQLTLLAEEGVGAVQ